MISTARKTITCMMVVQAAFVAVVFAALMVMLLWAAYSDGYSNGRTSGLQEGWEECGHPMRDQREGVTRCPGSDLPGVALDLR